MKRNGRAETEEEYYLRELKQTQKEIAAARNRLSEATEAGRIDEAIFELNGKEAKFSYLIKKYRELSES